MKPLGDALESSIRAKGAVAKLFGSPEMESRFCGRLDTNSPRKVLKSSPWGSQILLLLQLVTDVLRLLPFFIPSGVLIPVKSKRFSNGHRPGVRESRKLKLRIHFLSEFFVVHPRPPLLARLGHGSGVMRVERGVIRCTVGFSNRSEHGLDLRKRANDTVLFR